MPVRKWKRQATEWEKVFVLYLPEKGLTKSSYQEYIRNDKKIRKYRSSKWAKDLKDVEKKWFPNGQYIYEEMINLTGNQRNKS